MKLITGIIRGNLGDLIDAYQKYGCYPENINQMFENWAHFEGKKVDIIIERHKTKRTNPQNRYWWGVVLKLITDYMNEQGYELREQDWHDYYVNNGYFGYKQVAGFQVPRGSSDANTLVFNEVIDRIQKEWSLRGLIIPDPNQTEFLDD
jgi:hypothetical protein